MSRRLSVTHFHPCLTGSGGDRVSEAELRYLAAQGHRISFLLAYEPCGYEENMASLGADWMAIHGHQVTAKDSRLTASELMPQAVQFLLNQETDLIHSHSISALPQALILSRELKLPLFITVHTLGEKWEKWRWSYKPNRRRQFVMIREAFAASKGLFAVSKPAAENAIRVFGDAARHIQYLPNPIHDAFFSPPLESARDYDVAILGRPVQGKNPQLIARVLSALLRTRPEIRIAWIGAVGDEKLIEETIRDPALRNAIDFRGKLAPDEVRSTLLRSKVLFHPSFKEGFGLASAEAALSGCRLALSDIPALKAHFNTEGVWFFPPTDAPRAVSALISALDIDAPTPDSTKLGLLTEAQHGSRLLEAYNAVTPQHLLSNA